MSEHDGQDRRRDRGAHWERRLQSVGITLAVGAIMWSADTLFETSAGVRLLTQRIDQFEVTIAGLYSRDDAGRDIAMLAAESKKAATVNEAQTREIQNARGRILVIEDRLNIRRPRTASVEDEQP